MNHLVRKMGLKHYAEVNPPTSEFKEIPDGENVTFLPLENIWPFGSADYSRNKTWGKSCASYTQFRRGHVLVPKVTPTVFHGRSMIAEIETEVGLATSEVHVLRPRNGADKRWIAYNVLSSQFLDDARGAVYGVGGLQRISAGYLGDYKVLETDIASQRRIADYLDRETAEIDAAVADLDRYVELLETRRPLVVAQVVGGQMVPEVKYCPDVYPHPPSEGRGSSGAKSVKLAHLVTFRNGQDWKSVESSDGDFPVYGSGGKFGLSSDFLYDGEAVLFGRKGTVNRPIYVNEKFWTVDTMYYAIPNKERCNGKYLYYWATTIPFETITTNTALPSVTSMDLSQLYVPLPPLDVQLRIADYLDRETAEIDSLIAESTKLRELLLKRRSVLITEVVTGRKQV